MGEKSLLSFVTNLHSIHVSTFSGRYPRKRLKIRPMDKAIAFFFIAVGLVYSDLASSHWLYGYLLPGALVLGLAYLFWPRPFLALCGGYFTFQYMDIGSQSWFSGVILPLIFALCVLYFILWMGMAAVTEAGQGGSLGGDSGGDCGDGGDGGDGSC